MCIFTIQTSNIKPQHTSMSLPTEPMVKRLKPHPDMDQGQDQALVHCPRCDSANTKFCYYNNYSLSQPRYFCKSCRRYWTKGGTLRNIPMGGVSRKNKRLSSFSAAHHRRHIEVQPPPHSRYDKLALLSDGTAISRSSIALQHSYPSSPVPFSKNPDRFTFEDLTIDFMESGSESRDYNGGDYFSFMAATRGFEPGTGNIHGLSPFTETMSYFDDHYEKMINGDDVKPKVFDSGCHSDLHGSGVGRNGSSGYLLGHGSTWAGLINGYGSSSTNPLV